MSDYLNYIKYYISIQIIISRAVKYFILMSLTEIKKTDKISS